MVMSKIQSTLPVWLCLPIIALPAVAFAQTERALLGANGNWSAYEQRSGEMRLCYVKAPLAELPAPHERVAGAALMVTHQAMRGGNEMIRLELGPAFFRGGDWSEMDSFSFRIGEYSFALEFRRDLIPEGFIVDFMEAGYAFDRDRDLVPEWRIQTEDLLDEIRNAEAAGIPATFEWYPQGSEARRIAGAISFEGFSGAYEMSRAGCPMLSYSPEPVHVSSVRPGSVPPEVDESLSEEESEAIYREWLSHGPYLEFDVVGRSFFMGGEDETLTVRAVLRDLERVPARSAASAIYDFDSFLLSYAVGRIEYYRNGKLFYTDDDPGLDHNDFLGTCAAPADGRLNLLFNYRSMGSAGWNLDWAAHYDPGLGLSWQDFKNLIDVALHEQLDGETYVNPSDCAEGQQSWVVGGVFTPCVCRWREADAYVSGLNAWSWEFEQAAGGDNPRIDDGVFLSLYDRGSEFKPFTWWDPNETLHLRRFESAEFEVASVWFDAGADLYGSFQYVHARRLGEPSWLRIHKAHSGRDPIDLVAISGFRDAHLLERSGTRSESYRDQVMDLNDLFAEAGEASAGED